MQRLVWCISLAGCLLLSGCVVRSYTATKDRVDQELSGNRGYLMGKPTPGEEMQRKSVRSTNVVEVELGMPFKFGKSGRSKKATKQSGAVLEEQPALTQEQAGQEAAGAVPAASNYQEYTVQKNDTLQNISQKFFGTTKKWYKIYEVNKDTLKSPDRVYPGQVILIPVESAPAPAEPVKKPQGKLK